MKRYPIKTLFCLIGIFLIFRSGPAFCGWVDRLEDWSRGFHEFEETFVDSTGWWVAKNIGGRIAPYFFWEEALSKWNPIGNALVPLEEPIPGLDIRGRIKYTMRPLLHGNIYEDKFPSDFIINPFRIGGPGTGDANPRTRAFEVPCPYGTLCGRQGHADPDVSEASWLTELEFEYSPVPWFRFDTIFQYRYDAAYDWFSEFKKLYKSSRTDLEIQGYRTDELILRELFVNITRQSWEITLGKQQVAWGKMFTRVMDFINPDFLGVGIDESGRHPLWMARVIYRWKDWHFEGAFTPDWERNIGLDEARVRPQTSIRRLPAPPRPPGVPPREIAYGTGDIRYDKPGDGFSEPQMGFRVGFEKGKWEVDLAYWWGWTSHTLMGGGRLSSPRFRRVLGVVPIAGRLVPVTATELQEARLHYFALSVVRPLYKMYRDWIIRFENVLIKDYPHAVYSFPYKVGANNIKFDPDLRKKKDWLVSAFELSTSVFRDFDVSFASIITAILPYDSLLVDQRPSQDKLHNMEHRIRFGISKSFFEGRMRLAFAWDTTTSQGDGRLDGSFSYALSDWLTLDLGVRDWYGGGDWRGNDVQHDAADEFRFGLNYSF